MPDARLIIGVAPNGARLGRDDHPALPITAAELAVCALDVAAAGAALLHLHVRDAAGQHSLDVGRYRETLAAIREVTGDRLILQVTTEAAGQYSAAQQRDMVETLQPEAVSLALAELCPDEAAEPEARAFFCGLARAGILMQFILYSPEELLRFERLRQQGFFGVEHPFVLLVLGRKDKSSAAMGQQMKAYREVLPRRSFPWAVCAFGRDELAMAMEAARLGGHARVGFENNCLLADGSVAADNAALVRQLVGALPATGRRPAGAAEARQLLSGIERTLA